MENISYKGRWWLPENPEKKVAGVLSFSANTGVSLEVFDNFDAKTDTSTVTPFQQAFDSSIYKIILGVTENGKAVTLWECQSRGSVVLWSEFEYESYHIIVSVAFIGHHFPEENLLLFQEAHVQYTYLPDWASTTGFSWTKYNDIPKIEVHYQRPEDIKIATSNASISLAHSYGLKSKTSQEFKISQEHWLIVEAEKPKTFDSFNDEYIQPLQDFLSFATTKPNAIIQLQLKADSSLSSDSLIDVYFRQREIKPRTEESLRAHNQLFTLQDVQENIGSIIEKWLNIYQDIDDVFNLFFSIEYNPKLYLNQQFLYIAQAVETYHRRRKKNHVTPPKLHKTKVKAILDSCEEENKKWLQGILNFSNEPRLKDRLDELVTQTTLALSYFNIGQENFVLTAKHTRNYLTHYDKKLEKKAAKGLRLFRLTQGLSYLLQACILDELGLPPTKQKELFERNQTYVQAKFKF